MGDFLIILGSVILFAVLMDGVVKIIHAAKAPGGKKQNARFGDIDSTVAELEEEIDDLRERIQVLEKIITDEKHQLDREIRNLAG